MMAMAGSRLGWYHLSCAVRLARPAAKKADSRFSRKLTAPKEERAEGEMWSGRGPLGGAPPASEMVWGDWSRGRTRAVVVVVVERKRERERVVRRVGGYMIDLVGFLCGAVCNWCRWGTIGSGENKDTKISLIEQYFTSLCKAIQYNANRL